MTCVGALTNGVEHTMFDAMSIHITSNGAYDVRWREDGKNRSKRFRSPEEAHAFHDNLRPSDEEKIEYLGRIFLRAMYAESSSVSSLRAQAAAMREMASGNPLPWSETRVTPPEEFAMVQRSLAWALDARAAEKEAA